MKVYSVNYTFDGDDDKLVVVPDYTTNYEILMYVLYWVVMTPIVVVGVSHFMAVFVKKARSAIAFYYSEKNYSNTNNESNNDAAANNSNHHHDVQDRLTFHRHRIIMSDVLDNGETMPSRVACFDVKDSSYSVHDLEGSNDTTTVLTRPFNDDDSTYLHTIKMEITKGEMQHTITSRDDTSDSSAFCGADVTWMSCVIAALQCLFGWAVEIIANSLGCYDFELRTWCVILRAGLDRLGPICAKFESSGEEIKTIVGYNENDEAVIGLEKTGSNEFQVSRRGGSINKEQSLLSVLSYHDSWKERKTRMFVLYVFFYILPTSLALYLLLDYYFEDMHCAYPKQCIPPPVYPEVWSPQLGDWYQCTNRYCMDYQYSFYGCKDLVECETIFYESPYFNDEDSPTFNMSFLDVRFYWYDWDDHTYSNMTFGLVHKGDAFHS